MIKNLKDKFIIVVPARLGSKSIKNKNIIPINSLPMITYTFRSIEKINLNKFVLSNDPRVIDIAKKYKLNTKYKRPSKVSRDKSSTLSLLKDFHLYAKKKFNYD